VGCRCGDEYRELSWATHPWVLRDAVTCEGLLVCVGAGAAAADVTCTALWTSGISSRPAPAPRRRTRMQGMACAHAQALP
jgi:hypothetical protein